MFGAIQRSILHSAHAHAPAPADDANETSSQASVAASTHVFECTVGQKPSRAPFYLNDPAEVLQLLARVSSL